MFSKEQGQILCEYLITDSKTLNGLNKNDVRKFTYNLAQTNNIKHPESWDLKTEAGNVILDLCSAIKMSH